MLVPEDVYWDEELVLLWPGGTRSRIKFYTLRLACPCAECVDELSGVRKIKGEDVSLEIKPIECRYVGNYSLQFVWSDRHSNGIYTFEYLKKLSHLDAENK